MSTGQWELVGASKKPKSSNGAVATDKKNKEQQNSKGSKTLEKSLLRSRDGGRSLHKFKIMNLDDEIRGKKREESPSPPPPPPVVTKPVNKTAKKIVPAKPKMLKDAVHKLNLNEIQSLLKVLKKQFQESPLIWLKDLASFLNVRLNPSTAVDPAYKQESGQGAPLDYLSIPIREFLVRVVQSCNMDVLSSFHRHCFTCMLHEATRGLPVHGYAIFIQILGNVCREACITNAKEYVVLREMYDSHPRPGLTYVWLLSNTIITAACAKQYSAAVSMWMDGMLPLVSSKQFSSLAVQCGKDLLNRMEGLHQTAVASQKYKPNNNNGIVKNEKTINQVLVSGEQIIRLLDICFASSTQIPRNVNKQLIEIYNKFKMLFTSSSNSSSSKEYSTVFQTLLGRLVPTCSPTMAQQIGVLCGSCLDTSEVQCWTAWQQMFPKHLLHSAKLLKLIGNESTTARVLTSSTALKNLNAFEQSSAKMVSGNQHAKEANREITRILSGEVAARLSRERARVNQGGRGSSSMLSRVIKAFLCLTVVAAGIGYSAVYFDNNKATFDNNWLGKLSARAGVIAQVQQGVTGVAGITRTTASALSSGCHHMAVVLGPYLAVMQARCTYAYQWVGDRYPGAAAAVADWVREAYEVALKKCRDLQPHFAAAANKISTALSSENISGFVAVARNYTLDAVKRIQSTVQGEHKN